MGYYINPSSETKEAFLIREGLEVPKADWDKIPKDSIPVILIDNGIFTAAGIAFSPDEYEAFLDPDGRPKKIFIVKKSKLKEIGCDFPGIDG